MKDTWNGLHTINHLCCPRLVSTPLIVGNASCFDLGNRGGQFQILFFWNSQKEQQVANDIWLGDNVVSELLMQHTAIDNVLVVNLAYCPVLSSQGAAAVGLA